MLIEKCDQRSVGEFYPILSKMFDWQLGWMIVFGAPFLALCFFAHFLWKDKLVWGWIAVMNVQFLGALIAIILILNSIMTASFGIW
jgi:hypothetical protein